MKNNVKIMVVQPDKDGVKDIGYSLKGRLLGACNEMDATKIILNWPVVERVLTGGTCTLKDSVNVMKDINKNETKISFGHLMVSLSEFGRMNDSKIVKTSTKHLFVSPPITLFEEEPNGNNDNPFTISLECTDGSIITMEECNNE